MQLATSIRNQGSISSECLKKIQALDSFDLEDEKSALGVTVEQACHLEHELKKFFALYIVKPGAYVIPGKVDELWHKLLEKPEKCAVLASTIGVHVSHRPEDPRAWETLLDSTKATYREMFGPAPNDFYDDRGMLCWGCGYE